MDTADATEHLQEDSNEFRMSTSAEKGKLLLLAGLFTLTAWLMMYVLSLSWVWFLLPLLQMVMYTFYVRKARAMELYTRPLLRSPHIVMTFMGGYFTGGEGLSIIDQSVRLNHLLSKLKMQIGEEHPVFQEVLAFGPYSVRERVHFMFEPEVRREVRKIIQDMCIILNHTPSVA